MLIQSRAKEWALGCVNSEAGYTQPKANAACMYRLLTEEKVAICTRGNLPYIKKYPTHNTVFNLMYSVGSWIYLPYK